VQHPERVFPFSAHRAKDTLVLLDHETPDFIPSASDRVTYRTSTRLTTACGVCFRAGRGYRTKISDVNELKGRLISEWATVSHTVIECADVNLSSGVSVYALAFMLQADILSTRRNRDDVIMTRVTFFERH